MAKTIRLKINGTDTELQWSEFVANVESTKTSIKVYESLDTAFILQCSTLFFLMQAGFVMMEAGSLSTKRRVPALLLKNMGDTVLCAFFYFTIGYALSYGDGGSVVGESGFAGVGAPLCVDDVCSSKEYALMFYRFLKAAASVTILSGCIAERVCLSAYYILVSVSICFALPLVSRWSQHSAGWASPYIHSGSLFKTGVLDFAGAGEVHIAGALPALILLPLIGPRRYRFQGDRKNVRLPGQNNYFKTLGTTIMWMSWYGQVCGGVTSLRGTGGAVVAKVAVNTTISAVSASIVTILVGLRYERKLSSTNASNGILAGLVGITGACATVEAEWALVIGVISALLHFSVSKIFLKFRVDDVVDGVPIHLCCGIWSLLATAIFSSRPLVQAAYPGYVEDSEVPCGILYTCNGLGVVQFGTNLVYCLAVVLWVGITSCCVILPLSYFNLLIDKSKLEGEDSSESDETEVSEYNDPALQMGADVIELARLDPVTENSAGETGSPSGKRSVEEEMEEEEGSRSEKKISTSRDGEERIVTLSRSLVENLEQIRSVYPDIDNPKS